MFYIKSEMFVFYIFFILGSCSKRRVSLSSSYLRIHDEEDSNTRKPDQVNQGKISSLLLLPTLGMSSEVEIRKGGLLKRNAVYVLTIKNISPNIGGVELLFDSDTDEQDFCNWQRYLEEAEDISKCSITRLVQAKLAIHSKDREKQIVKVSPEISDVEEDGKNLPLHVIIR